MNSSISLLVLRVCLTCRYCLKLPLVGQSVFLYKRLIVKNLQYKQKVVRVNICSHLREDLLFANNFPNTTYKSFL